MTKQARLRAIVGIGPITANTAVATVGNAREFKRGREMAAWLGLVPTQHSSCGHARLGEISCHGDAYLRTLLIQGARSSLQRAKAVATEKAGQNSCGYAPSTGACRSAR